MSSLYFSWLDDRMKLTTVRCNNSKDRGLTKFKGGHLTNFDLPQANDTLVVKVQSCFEFLKKKRFDFRGKLQAKRVYAREEGQSRCRYRERHKGTLTRSIITMSTA